MQYADGQSIDLSTFSKHYSYNYGLDYKVTIRKFLDAGLLCTSAPEQSLALYKVSELKGFLKQNNLPVSGNKDDLIQRIVKNTSHYESYFPQRAYSLTTAGRLLIDEFTLKQQKNLKENIYKTISCIRLGNIDHVYDLFETKSSVKNPAAIPYARDGIKKDINAISQYRYLGHDTDRELSACIVTTMFHKDFKSSKNIMKDLGYENVQDSELYTASTSVTTLRSIADFKVAGIKKYKISSCGDERSCDICKKMDGKTFSVASAKIGKNTPPFCSNCRCSILAVFKF